LIEHYRKLEPAKYWSLPKTESAKNKLKKALENNEYIATLKRDGQLYRFSKGGNLNGGRNSILQSRTVSKKTHKLVEKQDNVPDIMSQLDKLPPNTMLMGEICFPLGSNKISSDITSIMGCLPEKAVKRQEKQKLHYYIFDVLVYNGVPVHEMGYEDRMKYLNKIKENYNFSKEIEFVELVTENIEKNIAKWLEMGEEGGILMKKTAPYIFEKRPAWNSIKIKQTLTEDLDLVIMDFTAPTKEYKGKFPQSHGFWENVKTGELVEGSFYSNGGYLPVSKNYYYGFVGGFVLGAYQGDRLVEVTKVANLTDQLREEIEENRNSFIGKVVKVAAMSIDKEKRSLRHPNFIDFHPDKNPKECLYKDIFK